MGRRVKATVFKFKTFSSKQKKVLTWWLPNSPVKDKQGIICDGAIRSGKTTVMALSFVIWAMESFTDQNFAMCGKTIGSFRRNVLIILRAMLTSRGYKTKYHRTDNLLEIVRNGKVNYFYIFGGKDERSQDLIQGITLAGVFFDEVALMPESFVNQATGRCSVQGSKFWFNCNPEGPYHWFKKNWIDNAEEKKLLHLHFTMDDNFSLSDEIKARYMSMYSGVFFDRFILGLWAVAEGLIYRLFAENQKDYVLTFENEEEKKEYFKDALFGSIGIDFGGNRSKTTFVATVFHNNFKKMTAVKDYAVPGRKGEINPDILNKAFIKFLKELEGEYPGIWFRYVFADNEAQYLINGLRVALKKANININIGDSDKNIIVERIRCAIALFTQKRLFILADCKLLIQGLTEATWDKKSAENGKDVRLDDFSSDIDTIDGWEYSWERFMRKLIGG